MSHVKRHQHQRQRPVFKLARACARHRQQPALGPAAAPRLVLGYGMGMAIQCLGRAAQKLPATHPESRPSRAVIGTDTSGSAPLSLLRPLELEHQPPGAAANSSSSESVRSVCPKLYRSCAAGVGASRVPGSAPVAGPPTAALALRRPQVCCLPECPQRYHK